MAISTCNNSTGYPLLKSRKYYLVLSRGILPLVMKKPLQRGANDGSGRLFKKRNLVGKNEVKFDSGNPMDIGRN